MDRENEKYPSLTWSLISSSNCENGIDVGNERKSCCVNGFTRTTKLINIIVDDEDEVKKQLLLAAPLIASSLLQTYLQVISLMFVRSFGDFFLSAASMANFFISTTLFSFLAGMASALYTLCGQSYGAKQYHMTGIHTQRAMFVLLLLTIPLAFIASNTTSILISIGKNADIAVEAGQYANFLIPGAFGYAILSCLTIFLQTQNLVFPVLLASGITTLVHIFICWILVSKSQLGYKGAALANSISYWINVMLLALYVKFSPSCMKTWTGFSKKALYNIINFLRLAIPSVLMACLTTWSFQSIFLLSGLLPNSAFELRVLSVSLQTVSLAWSFHEGLSGAASIRVANELGATNPKAANLAVRVVLVIAMIEGTFQGLILMLVRNQWGYSHSNEIEVVKYVAKFMPILAATNFLGRLQCVLAGIVRGCGGQKIGACINFGSYYIVGIPLAILLAFFFNMGGEGLWLGIITGLVVQVSFFVTITISINWELEANKAKERVYKGL